MRFAVSARHVLAAAAITAIAAPWPLAIAESVEASFSRSVVKVYVTIQKRDYGLPWQSRPPMQASGTGFVAGKKRILTNAHIVSDARFIQVQKNQEATLHAARVVFIGHDCDLAILEVDEPSFFDGMKQAPFSGILPELNDEVSVLGYPVGGTKLSVTRGVVSRIDYGAYSHSGVDQHLVLQVDAAINPGNSGGPVFYRGKVVGMAFQGLAQADNIGYAIPMPVIRHFLDDIADGVYNGYPELGAETLSLQNPALVKAYNLTDSLHGVLVSYLDPFGAAYGVLRPGDVLLAIDKHRIQSDGTVLMDNTTLEYHELLERKQWGDSVTFKVWRDNAEKDISVPLRNPKDPFIYRNLYDEKPRYLILGGLVFAPLSRELLRTLGQEANSVNGQQLIYYTQYSKIDGLNTNRDEFVVLTSRLPHPVNTYSQQYVHGIVSAVNGVGIRNLEDMRKAAARSVDGFHTIRFDGMDHILVLDAEAARKAEPEILMRYGILPFEAKPGPGTEPAKPDGD